MKFALIVDKVNDYPLGVMGRTQSQSSFKCTYQQKHIRICLPSAALNNIFELCSRFTVSFSLMLEDYLTQRY